MSSTIERSAKGVSRCEIVVIIIATKLCCGQQRMGDYTVCSYCGRRN